MKYLATIIFAGIFGLVVGSVVIYYIPHPSRAGGFYTDNVSVLSTFAQGVAGIGTTTQPALITGYGTSTILVVGNDPGTTTPGTFNTNSASTTLYLSGRSQFNLITNTGTQECAFWVGTTFTTIAGACTP